jgi:glutathione S-transferase
MKLIASQTSPYARKVRIALAEKKIECDLVEESPWVAETTVPDYNPLGKVPVLVLDDGTTLFDSRVIVEYLDTLSPVGKLIPAVGRERAEVKTWEALADGVMDALILARLESHWPGRGKDQRSQAWIDRQTGKAQASFKAMSQGLGDKPFCAGIYLSLADIAVGCALGYADFRFPDLDWRTPYPNLAKLQEKLMQRASFADTVPA